MRPPASSCAPGDFTTGARSGGAWPGRGSTTAPTSRQLPAVEGTTGFTTGADAARLLPGGLRTGLVPLVEVRLGAGVRVVGDPEAVEAVVVPSVSVVPGVVPTVVPTVVPAAVVPTVVPAV